MYKIRPSRTSNYMNEHRAYRTKIESLGEKILTTNYTYVCDINVIVHTVC